MSNLWFRLYAEFLTDPKVQMMSEQNQRRLIMVLCLRCNGNVTLQDDEVSFQLRISNEEWQVTKDIFIEKGFIDKSNNVLNWDKRQFISDSSAERVARHRERKKIACNVTVTPPDTDTDTDTDTEKEKKHVANATSKKNLENKTTPTKKQNFETAALLALGIDLVLVQDFLKIRKTKLTQTAIKALEREALKAEITPSDAVRICIERSWQSFNSGWNWQNQKANNSAFGKNSGFVKQPMQRPVYSYPDGNIGDAIDSTSTEIRYEQARL